jgi:hypothetical protein
VCCIRLDLLDSQFRVLGLKIVEPLSSNEVSYDPVPCLPVVVEIYEMVVRNDVWAVQNNCEISAA